MALNGIKHLLNVGLKDESVEPKLVWTQKYQPLSNVFRKKPLLLSAS